VVGRDRKAGDGSVKTRSLLVLLLWTALALRVFRLDAQDIWWDEARNIDVASRPLSAIARAGELDIHPPLYFYLLHGWMKLAGDREFAVRFLSVLPGVLLVPLCYQLGRTLGRLAGSPQGQTGARGSAWPALVAAGAAALAPFLVAEAQETRMYTWSYLWLAAAGYGLARALATRPGDDHPFSRSLRPFAVYAVFSALALLTHYSAVFVIAAWQFLLAAWALAAPTAERRQRVFRWLGSGLAILLLFALQIPRALQQIAPYRNPTLAVPSPSAYLSLCWRAFSLGEHYAADQAAPWLWGLAFIMVGGLALWLRRGRQGHALTALSVCLLVPLALYYVVLTDRAAFAPRYISFVTPAYYLLIGLAVAGWARLRRELGIGVTLFLLAAVIPAQHADYFNPASFSEDTRGLTTWLAQAAGPEDLVLFDVPYPWRYYYRGGAHAEYLFVDINTVADRLTSLTQGYKRLFWVRWFKSDTDPRASVPWLLEKYGHREGERAFRGYQVTWYRLPPEPRFELAPALEPVGGTAGGVTLVASAIGGRGPRETSTFAEARSKVVPADKAAWAVLRWRVEGAAADYKASVLLRDAQGHLVGQEDRYLLNDRHLRARFWSAGEEALNVYMVWPLPGSPPGRYRLSVVLYDPQTLQRLRWQDGLDEYPLGEVEIVRPLTPPDVAALPMQHRLSARLGGLTLLGYDLPAGPFAPGATLPLRLYWRADRAPLPAYTVRLALRGDKTWSEEISQPTAGTYPTDRWATGEVVRDDHDWRLAADVPTGEYRIVVSLMETPDGRPVGETELGTVRIEGRAHSFDIPPVPHPLFADFGGFIELVGYDLPTTIARPGATIPLTLTWRARVPTDVSYTVFVHLLDENEQVHGQQDSVPLRGAAPTTGWLPGEVLSDAYQLPVSPNAPPGLYAVEVGFYDAATNRRLPLLGADGKPMGDRLLLDTKVRIEP
jgi:4-amino-4-deoxy-L-arabinose transferase-like glycosyltransferase